MRTHCILRQMIVTFSSSILNNLVFPLQISSYVAVIQRQRHDMETILEKVADSALVLSDDSWWGLWNPSFQWRSTSNEELSDFSFSNSHSRLFSSAALIKRKRKWKIAHDDHDLESYHFSQKAKISMHSKSQHRGSTAQEVRFGSVWEWQLQELWSNDSRSSNQCMIQSYRVIVTTYGTSQIFFRSFVSIRSTTPEKHTNASRPSIHNSFDDYGLCECEGYSQAMNCVWPPSRFIDRLTDQKASIFERNCVIVSLAALFGPFSLTVPLPLPSRRSALSFYRPIWTWHSSLAGWTSILLGCMKRKEL
jgi:hypothetical protein